MLTLIKLILALVLMAIVVAFTIANSQEVQVDLGLMVPQMPMALLVLLAVGVGILLGALVSSFYFMRIKKENANLRRQSRLAQQEVKNLRNMPISGH